jgi:molecular chaperone GrpE
MVRQRLKIISSLRGQYRFSPFNHRLIDMSYIVGEFDEKTTASAEVQPETSVAHGTEDALHEELTRTREQLQRVTADLQNFQRRIEKERMQWTTSAQAGVIEALLPFVEDFERALKSQVAYEMTPEQKVLYEGLDIIHKNLIKQLASLGVQEIDCTHGFNPVYHEALISVDAPDQKAGAIVEVLSKGYIFNGIVLKCAKVSVAR